MAAYSRVCSVAFVEIARPKASAPTSPIPFSPSLFPHPEVARFIMQTETPYLKAAKCVFSLNAFAIATATASPFLRGATLAEVT